MNEKVIIKAENLRKVYPIYRKQPGIAGALKALFHRTYEQVHAVSNISLSIKEGELVGFLGPNGAGKTTTIKMLAGIIEPSSGTVNVLGFTPYERATAYQHQFSLVMGQRNQLISSLPAFDSFRMIQAVYEIPNDAFKARLDELVNALDLHKVMDIQVRKLSLGQRMKCELVAALLHEPKILFLDEPTIGLDLVAQKNIREFIKKYNRLNKTTILLTSHYMEDIEELCDRVVIINKGSIVYDGALDALMKHYAINKIIRATMTAPIERSALEQVGEVIAFEPYAVSIRVKREQATAAAAKLLNAGLPIDDILIDEVDVDEVIRHIFAGKTG